ncbi:MAG TPA: P-II family nitrogen regulator [Anaerolineales bacterium]|nr:P-II family nitrogen regulator [Anaerolineales bacterium]
MFLILFVLHNAEMLEELLDAWEDTGITGATILHSSGLGRVRQGHGWRDDLPLMPSLKSLFDHEEYFSRTLFTVVENDEMVDKILAATEKTIGDLNRPDTGVLVVMPVTKVYGARSFVSKAE